MYVHSLPVNIQADRFLAGNHYTWSTPAIHGRPGIYSLGQSFTQITSTKTSLTSETSERFFQAFESCTCRVLFGCKLTCTYITLLPHVLVRKILMREGMMHYNAGASLLNNISVWQNLLLKCSKDCLANRMYKENGKLGQEKSPETSKQKVHRSCCLWDSMVRNEYTYELFSKHWVDMISEIVLFQAWL
jgi:hypothetical protein